MSWQSSILTIAIRQEDAIHISNADAIPSAFTAGTPFIHAMSRNGALPAIVTSIYEQISPGGHTYLVEPFAKLEGSELVNTALHVESFIDCVDKNPAVVLEATKIPYRPQLIIQSKEFEPVSMRVAYPKDAVIRDGYVYLYTEDQVHRLLHNATASEDPCPKYDDGESLEYVFNFLKSHHHLLKLAVCSNFVVIHGEIGDN